MIREIGAGIQEMIKPATIAAVPPTQAPAAPAGQAAVLSNFSDAIAALDNNDTATAKDKLNAASALTPMIPRSSIT